VIALEVEGEALTAGGQRGDAIALVAVPPPPRVPIMAIQAGSMIVFRHWARRTDPVVAPEVPLQGLSRYEA
jgi:hypothetical protein